MSQSILEKYSERILSQEVLAIDNFIKEYIPGWQIKIVTTLPFTRKIFGWEIVKSEYFYKMGRRVVLFKYGKKVAELVIDELQLRKWGR